MHGSLHKLSLLPGKFFGIFKVLVCQDRSLYAETTKIRYALAISEVTALVLTTRFLFPTVSKGLVPKPLHVPFRTEEDLLARAIAQGPKTVDVPASLPTPPHNNQEELR